MLGLAEYCLLVSAFHPSSALRHQDGNGGAGESRAGAQRAGNLLLGDGSLGYGQHGVHGPVRFLGPSTPFKTLEASASSAEGSEK